MAAIFSCNRIVKGPVVVNSEKTNIFLLHSQTYIHKYVSTVNLRGKQGPASPVFCDIYNKPSNVPLGDVGSLRPHIIARYTHANYIASSQLDGFVVIITENHATIDRYTHTRITFHHLSWMVSL